MGFAGPRLQASSLKCQPTRGAAGKGDPLGDNGVTLISVVWSRAQVSVLFEAAQMIQMGSAVRQHPYKALATYCLQNLVLVLYPRGLKNICFGVGPEHEQ